MAWRGGPFTLGRCLGSGGFGAVYEAYDPARGRQVAVKVLRRLDATAVHRFKQEFHVLAGVSHANLVTPFELHGEGDRWCFSMELVDGVDLRAYVRGPGASGALSGDEPTIETTALGSGASRPPRPGGHFDEARLRAALRQLAAGVQALHEGGKLHCDLKPSNIIVARDGLLKLLDLGLVAPLFSQAAPTGQIVGTPAYMSPEQCAGAVLTPASDWYGLGTILFELLTGTLPIGGGVGQLTRKQLVDAPDPRELAPDAPADLAALCGDLLRRAPHARPSGAEVLRRLGAVEPRSPSSREAGQGEPLGPQPEVGAWPPARHTPDVERTTLIVQRPEGPSLERAGARDQPPARRKHRRELLRLRRGHRMIQDFNVFHRRRRLRKLELNPGER